MRVSTKLLTGLLIGSLWTTGCGGTDAVEGGDGGKPSKGEAPAPGGGAAAAGMDAADFEVTEEEIVLPDEAKAKAEAEITDDNADEVFEALKSKIESGG